MQLMKYSPLALLVAGLMTSSGLAARGGIRWRHGPPPPVAFYEVRANQYRIVTVSTDYLAELKAGKRQLTLPLPDSQEGDLQPAAPDLLPAGLAAKLPGIRTFKGHGEANPVETGRVDLGPRASTPCSATRARWIVRRPLRNGEGCAIYYQQDAHSRLEEATRLSVARPKAGPPGAGGWQRAQALCHRHLGGGVHPVSRQYRRGRSAPSPHCSTGSAKVYQRDVAAEFQLTSGSDTIIFTDAATDPSSAGDDPRLWPERRRRRQQHAGAGRGADPGAGRLRHRPRGQHRGRRPGGPGRALYRRNRRG